MITRRNFLANTLKGLTALSLPLGALEVVNPEKLKADILKKDFVQKRWVFLVDVNKCVGCGMCVKACKLENDVPYDADVTRTWVERYVVTNDGKVYADSPKAAREGFTKEAIEMGEGHTFTPKPSEIDKAFFVPKLCNHCENPACVQVCPVGATYQTDDGVVLVDRKWCIGCGYCIMACPYGVRYFHPVYHTVDKCTLCYHRISKGLKTACVDACPFGARKLGNIKDANDPVARIIKTQKVHVLKEDYGTQPQAYYLGHSQEVR